MIERTPDPANAGRSTSDSSLIRMPRLVTEGSSPFFSGRFTGPCGVSEGDTQACKQVVG